MPDNLPRQTETQDAGISAGSENRRCTSSAEDAAIYYLTHEGGEAIYHGLSDLNGQADTFLKSQFSQITEGWTRAIIVRVIWQSDGPGSIEFLLGALHDPYPEVWKEALDGLVSKGGSQAAQGINELINRYPPNGLGNGLTVDWLQEAADQIAIPWGSGRNNSLESA